MGSRQQFGPGTNLVVFVGVVASLFVVVSLIPGLTKGDWRVLGLALVGATGAIVLLRIIKLDIRSDGIIYRNLSGKRTAVFVSVDSASWDRLGPFLRLHQRTGSSIKINLRTLPVRAVAILFDRLEHYGIPMEGPYTWTSMRMLDEIRKEQNAIRQGTYGEPSNFIPCETL
jgi:hypothetical protein